MLSLRLLQPEQDVDLFRRAYDWRGQKKHVQPDRMPFEVFSAPDPSHIAVGLFNGELLAVYFLHEIEPSKFQAHFTSQRGVSRQVLLNGAQKVIKAFLENGATQIEAWIQERNRPLRRFVETLGFLETETCAFTKNKDLDSCSVSAFVKYVRYGKVPSD